MSSYCHSVLRIADIETACGVTLQLVSTSMTTPTVSFIGVKRASWALNIDAVLKEILSHGQSLENLVIRLQERRAKRGYLIVPSNIMAWPPC